MDGDVAPRRPQAFEELGQRCHPDAADVAVLDVPSLYEVDDRGRRRGVVRTQSGRHDGNEVVRVALALQTIEVARDAALGHAPVVVEDHLRVAVVLRVIGRDGARDDTELVPEVIVLAAPHEHAVAAGRLPPERDLLRAQRVHAVMGVDAGEEVLDAVVVEGLRVAPAVAVDVRGHRRVDGDPDGLAVARRAREHARQHLLAQKLVQVQVVARDADGARADRGGERFRFPLGGPLEEALDAPERLAGPFEPVEAGDDSLVRVLDDVQRLPDEVRLPARDAALKLRVADVGVGVVDDVERLR